MSVLLISDADLIQVAAYAARRGILPPQISAMAFARGLREANVTLWEQRYGEVLDLASVPAGDIEAAIEEGARLDYRRIWHAIPSLNYNCDLVEGTWLADAVVRMTGLSATR